MKGYPTKEPPSVKVMYNVNSSLGQLVLISPRRKHYNYRVFEDHIYFYFLFFIFFIFF